LTYNLTSVANETFDDVYIFELEFQVRASDFTSGWYLLFLFVGILTSLWWRLLNEYLDPLKEPLDKLGTNNRRITYLVFLPIASFLIAVAIFRQFQKDITLTSDPLVNVVAGFTYGFFWESVTNKFGKTVFAGTDFSTPPPQPGPAGQGGGGGQSTNQLGGGPAAPLPGPQPPGAPTPQPLPAPVQQAPPAPAPQPASAPLQQPPAAPLPSPAAAPAEKKEGAVSRGPLAQKAPGNEGR
jgi:hypothetical protein